MSVWTRLPARLLALKEVLCILVRECQAQLFDALAQSVDHLLVPVDLIFERGYFTAQLDLLTLELFEFKPRIVAIFGQELDFAEVILQHDLLIGDHLNQLQLCLFCEVGFHNS